MSTVGLALHRVLNFLEKEYQYRTFLVEAFNTLQASKEDELQFNPTCTPKCERFVYKSDGGFDYMSKNGQKKKLFP